MFCIIESRPATHSRTLPALPPALAPGTCGHRHEGSLWACPERLHPAFGARAMAGSPGGMGVLGSELSRPGPFPVVGAWALQSNTGSRREGRACWGPRLEACIRNGERQAGGWQRQETPVTPAPHPAKGTAGAAHTSGQAGREGATCPAPLEASPVVGAALGGAGLQAGSCPEAPGEDPAR